MNKITKNTMGMFDCLKGVIVILVILSHCFEEVWAVNNCTDYSIAWKAIHCMTGIVMGIFFVISGYGFRPVKNLRGIKNQAKLLLRPILIVYLCFIPSKMIMNLIIGEDIFSGITERLLGLLFGHIHSTYVFGLETETITVFWYFVALFIGWVMLTLIFKIFKREIWRGAASAVCVVAGYLLALYFPDFRYFIFQSLLAVGCLYFGYLLKKKGWLFVKIPLWGYAFLLAGTLISLLLGYMNFFSGTMQLGLLDYGVMLCGCYFILRIYLLLFNPDWKIFLPLMFIGRNSILIICIHGFENFMFIWRLSPYLISENEHLMVLVFFICRFSMIMIIYFIVVWFKGLWNRKVLRR